MTERSRGRHPERSRGLLRLQSIRTGSWANQAFYSPGVGAISLEGKTSGFVKSGRLPTSRAEFRNP
jgi:hypothetical protein